MIKLEDTFPAIIVALIFALLYQWQQRDVKTQPVVIVQEKTRDVENTPSVLPYWSVYGQPNYWPFYLSPYWYYDVPYGGPIVSGGGYYPPHGQRHFGGRPGYSGVAVGGGGGGGHHR